MNELTAGPDKEFELPDPACTCGGDCHNTAASLRAERDDYAYELQRLKMWAENLPDDPDSFVWCDEVRRVWAAEPLSGEEDE